jgi:hypothetical protein
VRKWKASAPASPDLLLGAQPPAQPHSRVGVERPIRFGALARGLARRRRESSGRARVIWTQNEPSQWAGTRGSEWKAGAGAASCQLDGAWRHRAQ